MNIDLPARPEPSRGLAPLLLALAGICLLSVLYFAVLGALALGADALVNGWSNVYDLLVGARDAARKGEQRTLEMTGIALGCVIYLAAIAAMLTMARLSRGALWREPIAWHGFRTSRFYWALVAFGVAWGLAASAVVEYLLPAAREWFTLPRAPVAVISSFLLVVVLAPIAEELFFRGWIYTGLRQRFGFGLTLGLTSFLFAIGHWEKTHLYAAAVLPVGLALGWVRERTGSTRATALFHGLYNMTGWLLTYLAIH
jgi:membrane protease YdiL (CAAX protease family)